jgi:D-alanine transaminase
LLFDHPFQWREFSMSATGYVNGEFCDLADAKISILDRGLLFGDAVYETVRVNNGRLFRVADHYARMSGGLKALGIPVPFSASRYEAILTELAKRNGVRSGLLYIQVTRGAAMRAHVPPKELSPNVFAFVQTGEVPSWPRKYPGGVSVATVEDLRWQRCNVKTSMLLANALAKRQAADADAFEAILIGPDGTVREGAVSNLFAVFNASLRTHPADNHVLPGVTRNLVLGLARTHGIPAEERAFSRAELLAAEEAFLTGTTADVCPVVRVDGKPIGGGRIGPITAKLSRLLAEMLEAETK